MSEKDLQAIFTGAKDHLTDLVGWRDKYFPYKCADMPIRIVLFIAKAPQQKVTHKQLYISMPCATPTTRHWVKQLQKDGLIEVKGSQQDRRLSELTLTDRGIKTLYDCYMIAVGTVERVSVTRVKKLQKGIVTKRDIAGPRRRAKDGASAENRSRRIKAGN